MHHDRDLECMVYSIFLTNRLTRSIAETGSCYILECNTYPYPPQGTLTSTAHMQVLRSRAGEGEGEVRGGEVYVWLGKASSNGHRQHAMAAAKAVHAKKGSPDWAPLVRSTP